MKPNETPKAYRIRLYKNRELYGLTNKEIGDLCNKAFGVNWDESAHRKKTKNYLDGYNDAKAEIGSADQQLQNLNEELKKNTLEFEKSRVKARDERNELQRIRREIARQESYREQIIRTIENYQSEPIEYDSNKQFNGILCTDNDVICTLFDVHTGIDINNYFNTFNKEVLKKRMNYYIDKILEIQLRHGSENAYIILSELVSGIIHLALRIENNQNLIEQFLVITDYISQFLSELSYHFNTINVYVCPGNHSRCSARKEENMRGENMDLLVIPFLRAKLQNFKNIECHDNTIDNSIAMFSVRGQKVFAVHGDKDNINTMAERLTMYTSIKPDLIFCGHRHTNAMVTSYDTKVLQSGCLSGGGDEYCLDNRLRNKPEQIVAVVNSNGLDCFYDIKFA